MHDLTCDTCGNRVLVEKYSPVHTSVQWLTDSRTACPEIARHLAAGDEVEMMPTCTALRDSIERAVRRGDVRTDDLRHEPVLGRIS